MYTRSDYSSWYNDPADNYAEDYIDWDCEECGHKHKGDLVYVADTVTAVCAACDTEFEWVTPSW